MNRSFHWQVEAGARYWRQNKRSMPWTFPHDFADYGPESDDNVLGYWPTEGLKLHLRSLIGMFETQRLRRIAAKWSLDGYLSTVQVKEVLSR